MHLSFQCDALCTAVAAEPKAAAKPSVIASVTTVRGVIDGSLTDLVIALARLVNELLEGVPFKLTRAGLQCLVSAVDKAYSSLQVGHLLMLETVTPLAALSIQHLNRDVRACTLPLLARMLSHASVAELPAALLESTILQTGVVTHLIALLANASAASAASAAAVATTAPAPPTTSDAASSNAWVSSPGLHLPYALLALRGLLRAPEVAARCRADGALATALQSLPASTRQGAVGAAAGALLLRLGELGGRSPLGERLRGQLLLSDGAADACVSSSALCSPDALMLYPSADGHEASRLPLHRVILAARAPAWLAMLHSASRPTSAGDDDDTDDNDDDENGGGEGGGEDGGEDGDEDGDVCTWRLSEHEALALPHAACAVLWSLVATGHATLPHALRPKVLLAAAERLGLKPLLMAPPTGASGTPWLATHLGALVGSSSRLITREASVTFSLRDGVVLHAHSCLLSGTDYFRTLLTFGDSLPRKSAHGDGRLPRRQIVRVEDASEAAFAVLLRYVYTGLLPAAREAQMEAASRTIDDRAAAAFTGSATSTVGPADAASPAAEAEAANRGTVGSRAGSGEARLATEAITLWRRLEEQATAAEGWLHHRWSDARGPAATARAPVDKARSRAGGPLGLRAADALELGVLAFRYMLDPLGEHAHGLLLGALNADKSSAAQEVVALLVRAQEEAEHGASQVVFEWAVDHYELVHEVVLTWLGQFAELPSAVPSVARTLGEPALLGFEESLRGAMLRRRHGL